MIINALEGKPSILKKSVLTAAIVAVLGVGCSSDNNDKDEAPSSIVAGSVAKGTIIAGQVTAYTLSATGEKGAAVGSATTAEDGSYSLTMADSYDSSSPLLLELTPTDSTTMVCDVRDGCGDTAFGDPVELAGSSFLMTAVIPSVAAGDEVNAAITAFTSMATTEVLTSEVTDSSVLASNSKVSQIVGVNILSANPVNIADDAALSAGSTDSQRYAIMLAALANQAFQAEGEETATVDDLISNLSAYNDDFSTDGDIGDEGGLSPTELYASASAEIEAAGDSLDEETVDSTSQLITVMAGQIDDEGNLTPTETTGENPTEVAQAKEFVAEVRTWADALQDLEAPAETFLEEAEVISETLDSNSAAVLEMFAMGLDAAAESIGDAIESGGDVPASVDLYDEDDLVGTISITDLSAEDDLSYNISSSDLAGVEMDAAISLSDSPLDDSVSAGDVALAFDGSASNDDVSIELSNATFTIGLAEDLALGEDGNEPVFSSMALEAELSVESSSGEAITADAELKYVALEESVGSSLDNDMNITLEKVALENLSVTSDSGETAGLSVSLEVNDAASFDTLSFLNSEPVMYANYESDTDVFDLSGVEETFGITNISFLYYSAEMYYDSSTGEYEAGTCAEGTNADDAWVNYSCTRGEIVSASDIISDSFTQTYVNSATAEGYTINDQELYSWVRLEIGDMETAESFLDATLNVSGSIDLAEHDEATLAITVNKTGIDAGNMTATLGYAGKSLQMTAMTTNGDEDGTDASLSFSNADGVAMTVTSSDDWMSGNVTVGDEEVGTIEDQDGLLIIRYNDGTFESL